MEAEKAIVILVIVVLSSASLTKIVYDYFTLVDVVEFDMYLTVSDHVGVNVGTSAIFFGTTFPGGSSNRLVMLNNSYSFPVKVELYDSGDLSRWVYFSDNGFTIEPNVNGTVRVGVAIPEDSKYGNYTGKLRIVFRKI